MRNPFLTETVMPFSTAKTLLPLTRTAVAAAEALEMQAKAGARAAVAAAGGVDGAQHAAHGFAWFATYVEALRQMQGWGERLEAQGKFGAFERLLLSAAFGEYCAQIAGGIPMSQGEIVRPGDIGIAQSDVARFASGAVADLIAEGFDQRVKGELAGLIAANPSAVTFGEVGLDDEMTLVRDQFRKFALDRVVPYAHDWHLKDELIPAAVVDEMSALGVFGLTIPETFGGAGLGKTAMCVVSEELSRGYIGVGSLGTRSEIAAELILGGGTAEQKKHWLPKIASGEILPTAVFTEPNTGSDLGSLRTRAVRDGDTWKVTGNKTWITHAARADVMTLLVRTNPTAPGRETVSGEGHERRRDQGARLSRHEGIRDRLRRVRSAARESAGRRRGTGL
jgi:(2S)-methylsuccinyl-CoA dehydrogenase